MKAVNLLPPDYTGLRGTSLGDRLGTHTVALVGAGAAVVVVAALGATWHSASSTASAKKSELASLKVQLAKLSQSAAPAGSGVQARIAEINTTDATRVAWDGFMSRLARVLPEDVWLTGMMTANSAAAGASTATLSPTASSSDFSITGYTYSQKSVARLMRRLELLPWLNSIQLQSSQLTTVGPKSVFQFTITGGVNPLPAKEAS